MHLPHKSTLLAVLRERAQQNPEKIILDDGQHTLSAHALWQAVDRLRLQIGAMSCKSVAIAGDNSFGWIIADLALLGLPVRVVPLPGFFSSSQIDHVLHEAQIDAVLAPAAMLDALTACKFYLRQTLDSDLDICVGRIESDAHTEKVYEKVTFTSGSTGNAKGVRLSLNTLEGTAQAIAKAMQPLAIESHLGVLPYATLLENIAGVYAPLLQGVCVHVRRMDQLGLASPEQFNPFLLLNAFQQTQPHASILVPQLLLALVTLAERGMPISKGLRFIAVGGGKVAASMIEKARALNLPVYEGYGLSECGSVVALNLPGAERVGSVGRPLSHCDIRLGDDGEIWVRGAVMSGYLNAALTDAPSSTGIAESTHAEQEIATGDLGYIDSDGFLYVNGRKKNMFITAFGRNVNPEWIEAELLRYLPIRQVAVFGEALPHAVAIVVARAGYSLQQVEAAIADCNAKLPDYARIGQIVASPDPFTAENGLATANGRLRRFAIESRFADHLRAPTLPTEKQHELF